MTIDAGHHLHDKSRDNRYLGFYHNILVGQRALDATLLEVFLVAG